MPDPFDDIPHLPETHLYPPGDEPFRDANEEALFQATLPLFEKPPDPTASNRLLLITLGLYVLAQTVMGPRGFDIHWLATLIGAIFLHEMGHYLGMVLFGYRDVHIFFVPFFGAATGGHKHAAPVWQQVIVLLLGPLPGIVLAGFLYAAARPDLDMHVREAIWLLLAINTFNLLPLVPFDGGRVVNLLLFSRWAFLEAVFQLAAVAGLAFLGYYLDWWMLYVIAGLVLLSIPVQHRMRTAAKQLRKSVPDLPSDLDDLTRAEQRELFARIRTSLPQHTDPKGVAASMRSLHELAVTAAPGFLSTLGFLLLQAAGFAAAVGVVVWMTLDQRAPPPPREPAPEEVAEFLLLEAKAVQKELEAARLTKKARENPEEADTLRKQARLLREEALELRAKAAEIPRNLGNQRPGAPPEEEAPAAKDQEE